MRRRARLSVAALICLATAARGFASESAPTLAAICGGKDKVALFRSGNEVISVRSGEHLAGLDVVDISGDSVTLRRDTGKLLTYTLGEGSVREGGESLYDVAQDAIEQAPQLGPAGWKLWLECLIPSDADAAYQAMSVLAVMMLRPEHIEISETTLTIRGTAYDKPFAFEAARDRTHWSFVFTDKNGATHQITAPPQQRTGPADKPLGRDDVMAALNATFYRRSNLW